MLTPEQLRQLYFFKRPDHSTRMTKQVDVQRLVKALFRPPQNLQIERIAGGFFDQRLSSYPLLHLSVELPGCELPLFTIFHDPLGDLCITALDVHDRPDSSLQPEAVPPGQDGSSFTQRRKRQQFQFRWGEQIRMTGQHDSKKC